MRNLKRALSLAMASVMILGMMVVSAGAASYNEFPDKEKIVNKDAVVMVTELGIVQGMPDGTFSPEGNIDRASMTKMICTALNGGRDPNLSGTVVNSYTDTVGNWAAGYIEFCTAMGIVSGKGDKIFAPSANVTGSEAAKMLLVALGYNAETEGMVGSNWQVKTDVLASGIALYDKVIGLTSAPLTRDNAAQMIFNALNASVVKYEGTKAVPLTTTVTRFMDNSIKLGDGTTIKNFTPYTVEAEKSMLNAKYSVNKIEGVLVSNEFAGVDGNVQKAGVSMIGSVKYNVTTSLDMLGKEVVIYAKGTQTNGNTDVTGGAVISNGNVVVTNTAKKDAAGITKLLKDESIAVNSDTVYVSNYAAAGSITSNAAGQEYVAIDNNNDGTVDYVLQNTFAFGKVTKYSTSDKGSITVKVGNKTYSQDKSENVIGFEDVAKDDYIVAAEIGNKLHVMKAKTVTGNLDRVKTDDSLTVDGTVYKVSGVGAYDDTKLTSTDPGKYDSTNTEATFYLDLFGNIVAVGDAEESTSSNYALVLGIEANGKISNGRTKVVLSDGTTATYSLNKVETWDGSKWVENKGTSAALETLMLGKVVSYSINSDDEITLRTAHTDGTLGKDLTVVSQAGGTSASKFIFNKGKTSVTVGGGNYFANSSTVFYYMKGDGSKADVYVGNGNAPSVDFGGGAGKQTASVAILDDSTVKALVVTGVKASAAGNSLFLYNYNGYDSDYSYFGAIIDGAMEDINVNDNTLRKGAVGLYEYAKNAKGDYDLTAVDYTVAAYEKGRVTKVSGNSIFVGGNEYILKSNSVVGLIDGGDTSIDDETIEEGDYVSLVLDDGDIKAAFITTAYDEADFALALTDAGVDAKATITGDVITIKTAATASAVKNYVAPVNEDYTVTCTTADGSPVTNSSKIIVTNDKTLATMTYSIAIV